MLDTEAFREFKQGLTLLRDNSAGRALPHMQRAMDLDKNNPYYMSYLGVVLARSEQKWGEAERLCDAAVRMKRNQAQLYLNLAEVYATEMCIRDRSGTSRPPFPGVRAQSRWPVRIPKNCRPQQHARFSDESVVRRGLRSE